MYINQTAKPEAASKLSVAQRKEVPNYIDFPDKLRNCAITWYLTCAL